MARISVPTCYKWKLKYGGLEASELRRVKAFLEEVLDQHLFTRLDDVREAAYWGCSNTTRSVPTIRSAI